MLLRPRLSALLATLCILAVLAGQTFGIHRGFLCLCAEQPVPTSTAFCDGPHGAHCHAVPEADQGSSERKNSDREEHAVVRGELTLYSGATSCQALGPVVFLIENLKAEEIAGVLRAIGGGSLRRAISESPPPGVAVARTVVLRI